MTFEGAVTEQSSVGARSETSPLARQLRVSPAYPVVSADLSYFGQDGLMRRHDYAVNVRGGTIGAQYIDDYRKHSGIRMPQGWRVHSRGADNSKISEPVLISIDIAQLSFA